MRIQEFTFDEVQTGDKFEDLVVNYFTILKNERMHGISNVHIKASGVGVDGGRDIIVDFEVTDTISNFTRSWIIQCKFHKKNISTSEIADINIPTLIHSYNASGYLLICREKATSKLTAQFELLNKNCKLGFQYFVWSGEQFKRLLLSKSDPQTLQQFFPRYYNFAVRKSSQKRKRSSNKKKSTTR